MRCPYYSQVTCLVVKGKRKEKIKWLGSSALESRVFSNSELLGIFTLRTLHRKSNRKYMCPETHGSW